MAIYNYVEDLVYHKIHEIVSKNKENICKCDRCIDDMAAHAINGLPVVSYVTAEGGIYREVQNMTNDRLKIDIATKFVKAVDVVSKKSKHNLTRQ
ncbi:MAG TPA: late competence development ComFB family protein [Candidatus Wallbacteria bacterium]|nr:late competence development ComFB family protein [Candidatus Wallbacteria bacterium]